MNPNEKPAAEMASLHRLVSGRAFIYWLFIYQKWPIKPLAKNLWALWYAIKDLACALWKLAVIPFAPVACALAMLADAKIRAQVIEMHASRATPRKTADIIGTISYR